MTARATVFLTNSVSYLLLDLCEDRRPHCLSEDSYRAEEHEGRTSMDIFSEFVTK